MSLEYESCEALFVLKQTISSQLTNLDFKAFIFSAHNTIGLYLIENNISFSAFLETIKDFLPVATSFQKDIYEKIMLKSFPAKIDDQLSFAELIVTVIYSNFKQENTDEDKKKAYQFIENCYTLFPDVKDTCNSMISATLSVDMPILRNNIGKAIDDMILGMNLQKISKMTLKTDNQEIFIINIDEEEQNNIIISMFIGIFIQSIITTHVLYIMPKTYAWRSNHRQSIEEHIDKVYKSYKVIDK